MRRAGYAKQTALHKARKIVEAPGVQFVVAEIRTTYKDALANEADLKPAVLAKRMAELSKSKNDFAALQAIEKVLEHLGIIEPENQKQVLVVVYQQIFTDIKPLLALIAPDKVPEAVRIMQELDARYKAGQAGSGAPIHLPSAAPLPQR